MLGTLVALLLALFFFFTPLGELTAASWTPIAIVMGGTAALLLILLAFMHIFSWSPLQKAEKNMSPRLLELVRRDNFLKFSSGWLIFFSLVSFNLLLVGYGLEIPNRTLTWLSWIVLFGISLDLLRAMWKRLMSYLNPYTALNHFSHAAKKSILNNRELELCDVLDSMSEMAVKALHYSGTALCIEILGRLQEIFRNFMEASKSIVVPERSAETEALGIADKISYTLFYLMQRLEMINQLAAHKSLEPVCSNVITTLGKMALHAAKFDISLAPYPIQTLGKCALVDQKLKLSAVGVKATITLVEISKTMLKEIDVTFLELQDTFVTAVNQLKEIAQEAFKQDKSINISLLKQPLIQLKELFSSEKMRSHRDTPVIVDAIERALAEFEALEMVLKTLPPIPTMPTMGEEPPIPGKLV